MIRYVVPHKATGPLDFTLLRPPGRRLTKLITPAGIIDYDAVALFEVDARRIDSIDDVPGLLGDLAGRSDTCGIRAVVKTPVGPYQQIRRLLRDHGTVEGRFVEVPRALVMIDIEPSTCPVDPTDPMLVGGWLRRRLPMPFQMARAVVQLSSGAGIKPGARAHLWYELSRPLVRADLERLLGNVDGLDPSTFRAVQINYTAGPLFNGVDDPCIWGRIAVLPGYAEVAVPELAPAPARQAFAPGSTARPAFIPVGGGGGASAYAEAVLRGLAAARPGQRHNAIIRAGCRLFEIAQAGQLDPRRVAAQIKGVARPWGDLAEVDRILEWCWTTVQPKGLPR